MDAGRFYEYYHGHRVEDLQDLHQSLTQQNPDAPCIFLMGDSSLDNKHWFFESGNKRNQMHNKSFTSEAVNGYENVLRPPRMVQDVAYWLNYFAMEKLGPNNVYTINASIEESCVGDRNMGLMEQDEFVRDHISEKDYIVLSLGGNDIALKPTTSTIVNMIKLLLSPNWMIKRGWAPGLSYFEKLFSKKIENILSQVVSKTRPQKILVCMIYFLDEANTPSWANFVLDKIGYNKNPAKLQLAIKTIYERISFNMPEIEQFPLFEVLDGKTTEDYLQRVEPSVQGGRKMGEALLRALYPDI
mmetsp:Transcript_8262/g.10747  ORF Transcript_8262/g.10747 Transcript_8262/m.10747 type:complete len:300 (+) Transcript_8262:148-1047(+)